MKTEKLTFTAEIVTEEDMYVSYCLEVPISSQGYTVEEATKNLSEAVKLWLETASRQEVLEYFPHLGEPESKRQVFRTQFEVPFEQTAAHVGC